VGYDLYMVKMPDEEKYEEASARFQDLCEERNKYERGTPEYEQLQEKVWDAHAEMHESQGYWRESIWTMATMREILGRCGALVTPKQGHPSWPDWSKRAFSEEEEDSITRRITEFEPKPVEGIPAWKFSDNSGWLVTPAECRMAAKKIGGLNANDLIAALEQPPPRMPFEKAVAALMADPSVANAIVAKATGEETDSTVKVATPGETTDHTDQEEVVGWALNVARFRLFLLRAAEHGGFKVY
jgi:hypothetical protein